MRRVQPTGYPDDDLREIQRAQTLFEAGDLDVVALEAILFQPLRVGGYEGEPLDLTPQPDVAARRVKPELDAPERLRRRPVVAPVVVERAHPEPFRAKQFEVDVGDAAPLPHRKALGHGQQDTVFEHHGLPVPGQIGRRFARARSRIHVGGQATRGGRTGQQAAVLGAADGDRATGKVGQHRRTRQRGLGAGRNRHEHVLADLHVQHEAGQVGGGEQQIGTERRLDPREPDGAALIVAGRDLAALVELPIGGQVRLRRHAEHLAAVDDHGGVVDAVPVADGRADHQDRQQLGGGRDDVRDGPVDVVEQQVLQDDVFNGVTGQRQLRENGQRYAVVVALPGHPQDRLGVRRRVTDDGVMRARGDAGKALAVSVVKVHRPSIVASGVSTPRRRVSPTP